MRYSSLIFAILLSFVAPLAHADDSRKLAKDINPDDILHSARQMSQAMVDEDFAKLTDFTLPKVVQMMGGREKMIAALKAGIAEMKKRGYGFKSNRVDAPTAVADAGDDIVAIVPETLEMTVPGGTLTQKSYLIAVSSDQGKTWTFLDGTGADDHSVKSVLPNFPSSLRLPSRQEPIFERTK